MKTVLQDKATEHLDYAVGEHWKKDARELEAAGDNKAAINIYEKVVKQFPQDAYIYDRLLILYRKEKKYKKELAVLDKAIQKFTALLTPHKLSHSKKVASLSKSILHSVGLTDKRGAALYYPQPVARWIKRRETVKKKFMEK